MFLFDTKEQIWSWKTTEKWDFHTRCVLPQKKKKKKNEENFPELDIIMFSGAVPGGGPGGLVPPLKFNI